MLYEGRWKSFATFWSELVVEYENNQILLSYYLLENGV